LLGGESCKRNGEIQEKVGSSQEKRGQTPPERRGMTAHKKKKNQSKRDEEGLGKSDTQERNPQCKGELILLLKRYKTEKGGGGGKKKILEDYSMGGGIVSIWRYLKTIETPKGGKKIQLSNQSHWEECWFGQNGEKTNLTQREQGGKKERKRFQKGRYIFLVSYAAGNRKGGEKARGDN